MLEVCVRSLPQRYAYVGSVKRQEVEGVEKAGSDSEGNVEAWVVQS